MLLETAPRPVQIDELLESGVFTTSTGEKAVPAQVRILNNMFFIQI